MTSFVIAAKDKNKRMEFAQGLCLEREIGKFDISIIEKDTNSKVTSQSIGIEDIKRIQKALFLKPLKSATKAVIIEDAHLLTPEAQNALLKVLEEPPLHTIIILGVETTESLLPTILSRCQIISLEEAPTELSEKDLEEFTAFIEQFPNAAIGERLKKAEQLARDKDAAVIWIGKLILVIRDELITNYDPTKPDTARLTAYIKLLQILHTQLKFTNVNPRFAIESTFLGL